MIWSLPYGLLFCVNLYFGCFSTQMAPQNPHSLLIPLDCPLSSSLPSLLSLHILVFSVSSLTVKQSGECLTRGRWKHWASRVMLNMPVVRNHLRSNVPKCWRSCSSWGTIYAPKCQSVDALVPAEEPFTLQSAKVLTLLLLRNYLHTLPPPCPLLTQTAARQVVWRIAKNNRKWKGVWRMLEGWQWTPKITQNAWMLPQMATCLKIGHNRQCLTVPNLFLECLNIAQNVPDAWCVDGTTASCPQIGAQTCIKCLNIAFQPEGCLITAQTGCIKCSRIAPNERQTKMHINIFNINFFLPLNFMTPPVKFTWTAKNPAHGMLAWNNSICCWSGLLPGSPLLPSGKIKAQNFHLGGVGSKSSLANYGTISSSLAF